LSWNDCEMRKRFLTERNAAIALFISVSLTLLTWVWLTRKPIEPYREYLSPDGKFKLAIYRFSRLPPVMPGQSGDAPGEVRLYRTDNGKLLKRKGVEIVQIVDDWTWTATNVSIKFVADWKLPPR
jgi:hypothetical protein